MATTWPDDLFDFCFIPDIGNRLDELAEHEAEKEDWEYHTTTSQYPRPILHNYVRQTYKRVAEEGKIGLSDDGQFACFNTGLVTDNQEPLFASFEANRQAGKQPWFFKGWLRKGRWELNKFSQLPEMAHYFDDPSCLVFDCRKELRVNIEHIVEDNKARFPAPYSAMENYMLQTFLKGSIDNAKERVRRSYKTAIPQYYGGQVQLLLPLCLTNPGKADLAMVVERHQAFYRASTCLTLDMAYNNARQITKPERDWLQP
jgi:hypothetical protein